MTTEEKCTKFIEEYISTHSMKIGSLDDKKFKTAMDAITKAMVAAWVDGYHSELQRTQ